MRLTGLRTLVRRLGFDIVRYPNLTGSIGPHLLAVFERMRIDCVLDVGAHWGEYAALLRSSGYKGQIVSFEPVSSSVEKLRELSAGDPHWNIQHIALGSRPGIAEINVSRDSDLSSFLATSPYARAEFPDATDLEGGEVVEVRRLDEFLEEWNSIAGRRFFLKLDTQGWDLQVLEGAHGSLDRTFGIQSEVSVKAMYVGSPSYLDALKTFQDLGFELTGVFPVNRDRNLRVIELDCVLVKADSRL
jgi:FkbM family methyltransferase